MERMLADRRSRTKQYKNRFKKWELNKNVGGEKMRAISEIQKRRRQNENKETEFSLRNKPVPQEKIQRWQKRQIPQEEEALSPNMSVAGSCILLQFLDILDWAYDYTCSLDALWCRLLDTRTCGD
jgi:hypothetical protein